MAYFMPRTLRELAEALAEKETDTYLCAGATDLMIHLRRQGSFGFSIIDLTHLPDIRRIEEKGRKIIIGAAVTMTMLEDSPVIWEYIPALAQAAGMVGTTQIRNLATIGGNVVNASQSADTTPVLFAYRAKAVILDETGAKRICPVEEVVTGIGKNTLRDKEAIICFEIGKSTDRSAFNKVGYRKTVTISKVNACIKAAIEEGSIKKAVVYLGAVGIKALKAPIVEKALKGQSLSEFDEERLKAAVYKQIEANIPDRPSKHYKKQAALGVVMAIMEGLQQEQKGENGDGRRT